MKTRFISFVLAFLFGAVSGSRATLPPLVNYQGSLADLSGAALDTTVAVTFRIYDAPSGGLSLWSESHAFLVVEQGLFDVVLGSVTALPDSIWKRSGLWLGLTVGSNSEMTPRERLVAVPYAMRVASIDSASGGTIGGDVKIVGRANIGTGNVLDGAYGFVAGRNDTVSGESSTVSGGYRNAATGWSSTVGGGYQNKARGDLTTVGGGGNNTSGSSWATVSGGEYNRASGTYATVGGGWGNVATGDNSVIAGGQWNDATNSNAFVGGGYDNLAGGRYSTVSGGESNVASGSYSTIAGGYRGYARGYCATVVGGGGHYFAADSNAALGDYSTVVGGQANLATGYASLAAGQRAKALHSGSFVFSTGPSSDFASTADYQFNVRSYGGVRMLTNEGATIGVTLDPSDNTWNSVCDSTLKTNIRSVDTEDLLDRVARLPIKQWCFKNGDPNLEHISPMAQDFWKLFHLGSDSLKISTLDPTGIALAAIQELAKQNAELRTRIEKLEAGEDR